MTLYSEINSVLNDDTKTNIEKREDVHNLRKNAMLAVVDKLPLTFTRGKYEVSVLDAGTRNGFFWLKLSCKVDGVEIIRDPDFFWNTVPMLVPDPNGDINIGDGKMYREDIKEALKQIVVEAIKHHVRD